MSPNPLRPAYRSRPIGSVQALALALGLTESELRGLAAGASGLYRLAKPIVKPDGSVRQPVDALPPLKAVHRRMKRDIFGSVQYPEYLTGSIKGRDYVANAKLHTNKKIVICEDIQSFFPSVKAPLVYDVWVGVFKFHPDVAELLTALTTKDGALPQGAITSSYLANLVLYKWEPLVHAKLAAEGVTYSRYVDDIAVSSAVFIPREKQTAILAQIHGMLSKAGLRAKRKKHEIYTARKKMITTKLVVNKRVALSTKQRSAVRAAVFQLEQLARVDVATPDVSKRLSNASARVGAMGRLHANEARGLATRVATVRAARLQSGFVTGDPSALEQLPPDSMTAPPWDAGPPVHMKKAPSS